jgi:uncharacterized membrane protein YuzA (DUF378 family)
MAGGPCSSKLSAPLLRLRFVSQLSFVNRLLIGAVIATLVSQAIGVLLWIGHARPWLPLHIACGLALVVVLWTLTVMAMRHGLSMRRRVFHVLTGLVVIGLGLWQSNALFGERSHALRGLHLLVGVSALVQVRYLAKFIRLTSTDDTAATATSGGS